MKKNKKKNVHKYLGLGAVAIVLTTVFVGFYTYLYHIKKANAEGIDSYTKILNHFDSNYLDSIKTTRSYSSSGVSISSTNKFGGGSLNVTADGAYLSTTDSTDFYFGSGDFTVDLWVYPLSTQETYYSIIGTRGGNNLQFLPLYYGAGNMFMISNATQNIATVSNVNTYLTANNWHHLAAQRSGNTFSIYIDGTLRGSSTYTSSVGSTSWPLFYGTLSDSVSQDFKGYIDEVRVSKGVARYSGSTFTLPTAPYSEAVAGGEDDTNTYASINNEVPAFTAHATESWIQSYSGSASTVNRSESSSGFPTNEGESVVFSATAHDDNSDNYYLIVCDSPGVTANSSAPPTCTGTAICTSDSITSDSEANCSKSTSLLSAETYVWYAYVCDHNSNSLCSAVSNTSQGGDYAEAGTPGSNAGSPFHVNHIPTFTADTIRDSGDQSIEPGNTVAFWNAVNADSDNEGVQDTVTLYICSGEADQGGVTTAFDYYEATLGSPSSACTGGTLLCSSSAVDPGSVNANCQEDGSLVSVPTAHASDYTVSFYLADSHGYGTSVQSADYTVNDVAPVFSTYTTTDSVNGTIAVGSSDVLTRVVTFTDDNGDNDPTAADMVFFDADAVTDSCTSDENNCYRFDDEDLSGAANCTVTDRSTAGTGKTATGTDNSLSVSCDFTIWFNANASNNWEVSSTVTDGTGDVNFDDSNVGSVVAALSGINVEEDTIAYGSLAPGGYSTYGATTQTNLQNYGNQIADVLLYGTNMTAGSNTILAARQKWNHTNADFDWNTGDGFTLISTTPQVGDETDGCLNRDMAVRAVHDTGTEDEAIAWKISIPVTQESGSYTGTNTFSATASSSCTGTLH